MCAVSDSSLSLVTPSDCANLPMIYARGTFRENIILAENQIISYEWILLYKRAFY